MIRSSIGKRALACVGGSFALLLGYGASSLSPAATLEVDAGGGTPYQTIQSAIDAAIPGTDDVFVRCGSYQENVVMRDLVSVSGAGPGCTTIDGGQNGTVVTMTDISGATVLEGFTIRNGSADIGGGILIVNGSPVVTKNVIVDNHAVDSGAFTGCGGGIHITSFISAELKAITAPTITSNLIANNVADSFGGAIEIYADAFPFIANNVMEGNTAVQTGGAIDAFANSAPTILHNTIVRNCLQSRGTACTGGGGAVAITNSGADIEGNVIAWNEAASGAGGVDVVSSSVTFTANNSYMNSPANYNGVADPTGSNGNISTDPLFVDQRLNWYGFQPRSDSSLVDGAAGATAVALDIRGIPRPVDGNSDGSAVSDIGARENEGLTRLLFTSSTTLIWDTSTKVSPVFNLYRGDLQILLTTGEYVQNPGMVPGASQSCGLISPTDTDGGVPATRQGYFYLAVLDNVVEGILGFDGTPAERPFTDVNRCP